MLFSVRQFKVQEDYVKDETTMILNVRRNEDSFLLTLNIKKTMSAFISLSMLIF